MEIVFYIALGIVQVAILAWYFWNSTQKTKKEKERREKLAREYPYEGMRNIALNISPGAILANVPEDEIYVYGAVMDWDMGNDIVTLIAQVTGEANLYVKSGGGIVGGGKHINISEAAQKFTVRAQEYLALATSTIDTPLPQVGCVQFYLLTNKGKFTGGDSYKKIEDKTSPWAGLFEEASNVITEMRRSVLVNG